MNQKTKFIKSISIRCDEKMSNLLEELEGIMLLNTTSVVKLALVTLYEKEMGRKFQTNKGDTNVGL